MPPRPGRTRLLSLIPLTKRRRREQPAGPALAGFRRIDGACRGGQQVRNELSEPRPRPGHELVGQWRAAGLRVDISGATTRAAIGADAARRDALEVVPRAMVSE